MLCGFYYLNFGFGKNYCINYVYLLLHQIVNERKNEEKTINIYYRQSCRLIQRRQTQGLQ